VDGHFAALLLGAVRGTIVDYRHSGTGQGSAGVGYGGVVIA
jgi:hypothetical protein